MVSQHNQICVTLPMRQKGIGSFTRLAFDIEQAIISGWVN